MSLTPNEYIIHGLSFSNYEHYHAVLSILTEIETQAYHAGISSVHFEEKFIEDIAETLTLIYNKFDYETYDSISKEICAYIFITEPDMSDLELNYYHMDYWFADINANIKLNCYQFQKG